MLLVQLRIVSFLRPSLYFGTIFNVRAWLKGQLLWWCCHRYGDASSQLLVCKGDISDWQQDGGRSMTSSAGQATHLGG